MSVLSLRVIFHVCILIDQMSVFQSQGNILCNECDAGPESAPERHPVAEGSQEEAPLLRLCSGLQGRRYRHAT